MGADHPTAYTSSGRKGEYKRGVRPKVPPDSRAKPGGYRRMDRFDCQAPPLLLEGQDNYAPAPGCPCCPPIPCPPPNFPVVQVLRRLPSG